MELTCQFCGNKFNVPDCWAKRGRKYCSKKCYDEAQTKIKLEACKQCKRTFKPSNKNMKFCSQKCWYKWNSESSKITRTCKQCNKEFKIPKYYLKKNRGKFCSKECKAEYQRNKFINETNLNFRRRVFNFYPNSCFFCGSNKNLEAHHIIPQEYDGRFQTGKGDHRVRNGIILCKECHQESRKLMRLIKKRKSKVKT